MIAPLRSCHLVGKITKSRKTLIFILVLILTLMLVLISLQTSTVYTKQRSTGVLHNNIDYKTS